MEKNKSMEIHYVRAAEDTGMHRFRPVAESLVVNNRIVGRTLCKNTKWKTVGKGYTFNTWTSLGRWLMAAFAADDYSVLKDKLDPTVILPLKTNNAVTRTAVTGAFVPSRNITRVAIVYTYLGKTRPVGFAEGSLVTVCREFDMYTAN